MHPLWNMSFIFRIKHHLRTGFFQNPYISSKISLKPLNPSWVCRNFAQVAKKLEEDEAEEVEIDPRKLPADYDPAHFDPTAHRSPPSERVFRLVDEVSSLTLLEAAELGSILMKKMGISEAPVMGVLKPGAAAGLSQMASKGPAAAASEDKQPEKTVFELKLESFDASSKIKVIKEIRGFTELGLKEAKDLVEKSPAVFKKGVSKDEAEQIIEKLKAVGAKVVME